MIVHVLDIFVKIREYSLLDEHFGGHIYIEMSTSMFNNAFVVKAERVKTPRLLHPLQTPESNWQSISMDFITGLPRTPRQEDTILVVVDRLRKMAHFIATKETVEAPQVADLFISMYLDYMDYQFLLSQTEMCAFVAISGDIFLQN